MTPPIEVRLDVPGKGPALKLLLNPACCTMSPAILKDRIWEPSETRWILDHLHPGDVFVDVGANVGYFTVLAARRVGKKGQVYAFEPDPDNFALLQKNVELNGFDNVMLAPAAVAHQNGRAKLYLSRRNKGDHRLYETKTEGRLSVDVETVTLDASIPSGRVDLVKIDTQGAEVSVLRGMVEMLRTQEALRLVVEFWPRGLHLAGSSAAELVRLLRGHGFPVRDLAVVRALQACTPENGKHVNLMLEKTPA